MQKDRMLAQGTAKWVSRYNHTKNKFRFANQYTITI